MRQTSYTANVGKRKWVIFTEHLFSPTGKTPEAALNAAKGAVKRHHARTKTPMADYVIEVECGGSAKTVFNWQNEYWVRTGGDPLPSQQAATT